MDEVSNISGLRHYCNTASSKTVISWSKRTKMSDDINNGQAKDTFVAIILPLDWPLLRSARL